MNNFDGIVEITAIRAQIADLAGGRILTSSPDDERVPVDENGDARPYIVASFGVPFAAGKHDRAFGDGERKRPYVLTATIGAFAADEPSCNALYSAITDRLLDFEPNGNNALPLSIPYAYNTSSNQTSTRPATVGRVAALQTTINLST